MRAFLSNFSINLRRNGLQNISLIELQILGVFVKTLSADENYRFGDYGDLQFRIQMQLS